MLAVSVVGLFAFVALAVDLGMLAVSRNHSQNAADIAAMVGTRTLNNKPTAINNDLILAVANAKATATSNILLSTNFTDAQVQKIEVGQFLYDSSAGLFRVSTWTDVTNSQSAAAPSGSWTAIRVTLAVAQPTYFMKVMGITSMPSGAVATAVYRPRDTAFVLDMTGSMAYASHVQLPNGHSSMNPDNLVPSFGHYVSVQSNLIASANQANGNGEAISRNNICITTPGGPPIVRNFYYDPSNAANPTNVGLPRDHGATWRMPSIAGARPSRAATRKPTPRPRTTSPATTSPSPTPAPDSFKTMTDSGSITYVGDRWRRADGSINKTNTSWATASTTTKAAGTAIELLGYNVSGTNVRSRTGGTTRSRPSTSSATRSGKRTATTSTSWRTERPGPTATRRTRHRTRRRS